MVSPVQFWPSPPDSPQTRRSCDALIPIRLPPADVCQDRRPRLKAVVRPGRRTVLGRGSTTAPHGEYSAHGSAKEAAAVTYNPPERLQRIKQGHRGLGFASALLVHDGSSPQDWCVRIESPAEVDEFREHLAQGRSMSFTFFTRAGDLYQGEAAVARVSPASDETTIVTISGIGRCWVLERTRREAPVACRARADRCGCRSWRQPGVFFRGRGPATPRRPRRGSCRCASTCRAPCRPWPATPRRCSRSAAGWPPRC